MEDRDELTLPRLSDDMDDASSCDATLERVIAIVAEVLARPHSDFTLETRAADVEGWDSFGHVRIVLAIDKAFGIHLSMQAIERAESIAGLVEAVEDARRTC